MFEPENRYVTCGISDELPGEIQMMLWLAIDSVRILTDSKLDYLQVFTFKKVSDTVLEIRHEQEQPEEVRIHYTGYKDEYRKFINEKVFVIDDGDHSTMLFAYEY